MPIINKLKKMNIQGRYDEKLKMILNPVSFLFIQRMFSTKVSNTSKNINIKRIFVAKYVKYSNNCAKEYQLVAKTPINQRV